MARKPKPSLGDRIIAFFTGKLPEDIATQRGHTEPLKPRAISMPTETTYREIPFERIQDFRSRTHTMQDLEWLIMTPGEPLEVRRAAVEEWVQVAPKPLRPHIPGIGHDSFWRAFRDAYHEQELW